MLIQTTKIYATVDSAIRAGYKVVSAQGSSRSSKTYNILIYLLIYILQHPKTSLSIVRKTLPSLKGSVFRDFKEIMQDKFQMWDNRCMNKSDMVYTFPNGSFANSSQLMMNRRYGEENVIFCIVMKAMKSPFSNGNNW